MNITKEALKQYDLNCKLIALSVFGIELVFIGLIK